MSLVRLAATPPCAPHARRAGVVRAVEALVAAPHRVLARAAAPSLAPALSPRLPAPAALLTLVRALAGRLVVANPCAVAALPWSLVPLLTAALQAALRDGGAPGIADGPVDASSGEASPADLHAPVGHDARAAADRRRLGALARLLPDAGAALAPGAAWAAAALYEPTRFAVHLAAPGTEPPAPEPLPAVALLAYRLAIVVGRTDAPPPRDADGWAGVDARVAAAPATAWPPGPRAGTPWFARRVLVPDALAADGMDAGTLARWADVTGRSRGGAPRDRYWFGESWARFCEPGRQVGFVAPDFVARSRRARRPVAVSAWGGPVPATPLDPAAERGTCVPPGYCLLDCVGSLELSVTVL